MNIFLFETDGESADRALIASAEFFGEAETVGDSLQWNDFCRAAAERFGIEPDRLDWEIDFDSLPESEWNPLRWTLE